MPQRAGVNRGSRSGLGEARDTDAYSHEVIWSSLGDGELQGQSCHSELVKMMWRAHLVSGELGWSPSTNCSCCGSRQGPNAFTCSENTAHVIGNQGLSPKFPSPAAGSLQVDFSPAQALCSPAAPCPGATTMVR